MLQMFHTRRKSMQQIAIRIKGQLEQNWSSWFDRLSVQHTMDGHIILSGQVNDQPALYGLLYTLSNLGPPLVSVEMTAVSSVVEEVSRM
jgi:hypothetical protein